MRPDNSLHLTPSTLYVKTCDVYKGTSVHVSLRPENSLRATATKPYFIGEMFSIHLKYTGRESELMKNLGLWVLR